MASESYEKVKNNDDDEIIYNGELVITKMLMDTGMSREESIRNLNDSGNLANHLMLVLGGSQNDTHIETQSPAPRDMHMSSLAAEIKAFTLDSVFKQIGGFGRLQLLTLICLAVIRNLGMATVYSFALSTKEFKLECRTMPTNPFVPCKLTEVCMLKK